MKTTKNFWERNISTLVIVACVGVFLALLFSNAFLLHRSSAVADKVHFEQEHKLVKKIVDYQVEMIALDQSQISNWSDTLDAVEGEVDKEFVKNEIAGWLWDDFDIKMSVVVSEDDKPLAAAYEDRLLSPEDSSRVVEDFKDLIADARQRYHDVQNAQSTPILAFVGDYDPVRSDFPLYVWSIWPFNGTLSYVVAQVIAPDTEGYDLGNNPKVLVSLKSIDQKMFERISDQLDLQNFRYTIDSKQELADGVAPVRTLPNGMVVHARWTPSLPSETILEETLPTLTMPFFITFLALGLIAWRFSRILKDLQQSEEQNRFLALHDALTGLPNRLHFDRALESIIENKKQDRCAILCMDLDRFKAVNDTFGHQAGDVVLTSISERVQNRVGANGIAARVGGDEFVILLRDQLEEDQVLHMCDQLIEEVSLPILVPGGVAEVGASIGVAWWPDDAMTVKSIIRSADEALYASKQQGRGQVSCASRLRRVEDIKGKKDNGPIVDRMKDAVSRAG